MKQQFENIRILIGGGGTGGHVFPAISIAKALVRVNPGIKVLFVGAEGKLEMEKVPEAGFEIRGLPVAGFRRSLSLRNLAVIWKLLKSLVIAGRIIKEFRPHAAVGVGGYASGPIIFQASRIGIPVILQEQNSYAGVTNRLLARRADKICVAYEGMEKYFPAGKIIKTGNPVRQTYDNLDSIKNEAIEWFGLKNDLPVVLILGGSLGAGTINSHMAGSIQRMNGSGIQWIWQTGRGYYEKNKQKVGEMESPVVKIYGFIDRMDYAFAAADLIISRAGAGTISELCLAGRPVILVPSPNVAEDHQTRNAEALASRNAAVMITDIEAGNRLTEIAISLMSEKARLEELSQNIRLLADRDADTRIAAEVLKLIEE